MTQISIPNFTFLLFDTYSLSFIFYVNINIQDCRHQHQHCRHQHLLPHIFSSLQLLSSTLVS